MLAGYLSELLLHHDCVILPGFGGLLAQPVPAIMDSDHDKIYPPSRRLSFNSKLTVNDGLLASCVSQKEGISYAEAYQQVMQWVNEIQQTINAGSRFMVPGVGSFFLNYEKKIQFTPQDDNLFLLSSYGLKPVLVTPSGKATLKVSGQSSRKQQEVMSKGMLVAATLFILLLSVYMFPRFEWQLASLSGLWPEWKEKVWMTAPASEKRHAVTLPSSNENTGTAESIPLPEKMETQNPSDEFIPEETVAAGQMTGTDASVTNENLSADLPYLLIAGCFRIEENAEKLQRRLSEAGLNAFIAGKTNSGLTMVSAGSFSSVEAALQFLHENRELLTDGGWVYRQGSKSP
jgi:hypothetical protein